MSQKNMPYSNRMQNNITIVNAKPEKTLLSLNNERLSVYENQAFFFFFNSEHIIWMDRGRYFQGNLTIWVFSKYQMECTILVGTQRLNKQIKNKKIWNIQIDIKRNLAWNIKIGKKKKKKLVNSITFLNSIKRIY